jgi:hypothetical protein
MHNLKLEEHDPPGAVEIGSEKQLVGGVRRRHMGLDLNRRTDNTSKKDET